MSAIEKALDPKKDDYGEQDEISFVLSISTLIKKVNVAPKNIAKAIYDELEIPIDASNISGEYAIPQDQDDIDNIVAQIPDDSRKGLIIDTNNDGIWDRAGIIIGVVSENQKALMGKVYDLIDKYYIDPNARGSGYNSPDSRWHRIEDGEIHCAMTISVMSSLMSIIMVPQT